MKRYSLLNLYIIFFVTIFTSFIVLLIFKITVIQKDIEKEKLISTQKSIITILENTFNYTEDRLLYISNLIQNHGDIEDQDFIYELLKSISSDKKIVDILSWSTAGWVSKDNIARVDGSTRNLKNFINLNERDYIKEVRDIRNKLTFGKLTKGYLSGITVIPAGLGVSNRKHHYIGAITVGFSTENLKSKLEELIDNSNISFALSSSEDNSVYFQSSNFKNKDILINKLSNFPFILLLELDSTKINLQGYVHIISSIKWEMLALFSILVLIIFFLYIFNLKPFIVLAKYAKQVGSGDNTLSAPTALSKEEMLLISAIEKIKLSFFLEKDLSNKLELINHSLEQKVEERTLELSHALAAKTEFLNNMSHEIRTPIQGFTAISEGLVDHWNDFAEAKKFELASQVAKNATRLSKLLGNLLDLSKFTAGKMVLEFNKYDMTAIVADIIDECEALYIGDRNIKLKMMSANSQIVMVDKERISQVLRNLLVNAIKFSADSSVVTVSINRSQIAKQEAIEVIVQDQGIGIPPEELELIFKPFTQSKRTKTKAGGTGLGLAICREIITAHHGKIWAENIIGGASFHFVIPIIQSKLMDDGKIVETASAKLSQTKQAEITMSVKPVTILLIDDEESCHMSMELLLHNSNYKLLKAIGGVEGKELLKKHHHEIDLILLDLMMPDIYGLNLLSQIKANPDYQHIPVILQTGTSDEEEVNKAYKLGIVAYIRKPYDKYLVLEMFSKIIN